MKLTITILSIFAGYLLADVFLRLSRNDYQRGYQDGGLYVISNLNAELRKLDIGRATFTPTNQ